MLVLNDYFNKSISLRKDGFGHELRQTETNSDIKH